MVVVVVVVVVVVFDAILQADGHEIVQEPSTTKNSSSSRAPKTGAQLRDNTEEREKMRKKHTKKLQRLHC